MNEFELTDTDIKIVLDIINAMCSRGAIKAQELSIIGHTYDKYMGILEKTQKQQIDGAHDK